MIKLFVQGPRQLGCTANASMDLMDLYWCRCRAGWGLCSPPEGGFSGEPAMGKHTVPLPTASVILVKAIRVGNGILYRMTSGSG